MDGPGLAKARPSAEVARRGGGAVLCEQRLRLWSMRPGWVDRLLAEADIFSEGVTAREPDRRQRDRRVYYGSTSLRCAIAVVRASVQGAPPDRVIPPTELAQALLADPLFRLAAVRIARREATARAGGALNVMYAQLSARVMREADCVRLAVDVDVDAELARLHDRLASE